MCSLEPDIIVLQDGFMRDKLFKHAGVVVNSQKWSVFKWMIDKCRFLLHAIKKCMCFYIISLFSALTIYLVRPSAIVIICQFHIIQALVELKGEEGRVTGGPKIPQKLKFEYCTAFQEAQRCQTLEEWPMFEACFFEKLERLCLFGAMEDMVE